MDTVEVRGSRGSKGARGRKGPMLVRTRSDGERGDEAEELPQEIYDMHEGKINVDIPGLWGAAGMDKIPSNTMLAPGAVGSD